MSRPTIAVLAFDRISPFHLSVPCLVLGEGHPETPLAQVRVCAAEPGPLLTSAGFRILVEHDLRLLETADVVIVPSWRDPHEAPPPALCAALRQAYQRGAQLVGLCLGAFVLAECGLLDGRRATTHWAYAAEFSQRYPAVQLQADVLYVEDSRLLTSAGTAAGIDCCLHWLRQHFGATEANRVARRLVVPPHRQGGQAQFVEQPVAALAGASRLGPLLDWLHQRLDQTHSLDSLAAQALMSRRSFTRHFRQQTGMSLGDWLLAARLALSQRLLEETRQPVERIAQQAGFGSTAALRQHFKSRFGLSPAAWRKVFRADAR